MRLCQHHLIDKAEEWQAAPPPSGSIFVITDAQLCDVCAAEVLEAAT